MKHLNPFMLLGGSLRGSLPNPELVTDEASLSIAGQVFGRRAVTEDFSARSIVDEMRALLPHAQAVPQVQAGIGISITYNAYGPVVNALPEALIDGVRAFLPPYVHPTWLLSQDNLGWNGRQIISRNVTAGAPRDAQLIIQGADDTVSGRTARLEFVDRGAAVDTRRYHILAGFGWGIQFSSDDGTSFRNVLLFGRSGVAVTTMIYGNSTDLPPHTFHGSVNIPGATSQFTGRGSVPAGGAAGEQLTKNSAADYDVGWAAAGGGSGGSATEIEQNLGNTPIHAGRFAVTDAAIGAASKLLIWQAGGFYTGKNTVVRDEGSMDPLWCQMYPNGAGAAIVHWRTIAGMSSRYNAHRVERPNTAVLATGSARDIPQGVEVPPMGVVGRVKGNFKFQYMVLS